MRRILACTLIAACGDGGTPKRVDAGADASLLVSCSPVFDGPTYYATEVRLLDAGQGLDLDGDGIVDNALAPLGASGYNGALAAYIAGDVTDALLDLPGIPPPPLTAGDSYHVDGYEAVDAAPPADPAARPAFHQQKLDGQGTYLVPTAQLDVDCQPTARMDATVTGPASLDLRADSFPLVNPAVSTVHLRRLRGQLTLSGTERADAEIGGILLVCALSLPTTGLFPQTNGRQASILAILVEGLGIQPDFDLGGNGIGSVDVEEYQIKACHDGQGTLISGAGCACNPRMDDGYSFAQHWGLVRGRIVGFTGGS